MRRKGYCASNKCEKEVEIDKECSEECLLTFCRASFRCSPFCIDFTWLSTCSCHVRLPFRTHLAIFACNFNVDVHKYIFQKKVHDECIALKAGLSSQSLINRNIL